MSNPGPIPQVDLLSGVAAFVAANGDFIQQKFDAKGKQTTAGQQNAKAGAPYGNWVDDVVLAFVDAVETGAISGTLDAVLANGNETLGNNIEISAGDLITSPFATDLNITPGAGGKLKINANTELTGDLFPPVDDSQAVGVFGNAFGNGRFVDFLVEEVLTVGDGLASPVFSIDKLGTGTGEFRFESGGLRDWVLQDAADEDFILFRYIADVLQENALEIENATGDMILRRTFIGKENFTLDSASPTATYGDGGGSTTVIHSKSAGGDAVFLAAFADGNRYWQWYVNSSEDMLLDRYIAGVLQDTSLTIENTTGEFIFANNVHVEDQLLVAGAGAGDGAIGAQTITFGDGLSAYGISAFIGAASIARFGCTDVSGAVMRGGFQMNSGGDSIILVAAGSAVTNATAAAFAPFSDGTKSLGLTGLRWLTGHIDNAICQDGVTLGDTTADGPTHFGGTGVPAAGLGANGDFYWDATGGAGLKGYNKAAGVWAAFA